MTLFKSRQADVLIGAPGEIRTPDHLVRSQILYPAELRALSLGELFDKSVLGRWRDGLGTSCPSGYARALRVQIGNPADLSNSVFFGFAKKNESHFPGHVRINKQRPFEERMAFAY